MNIMFITIDNYDSFNTRSIYMDLINEFISNGHFVTVLSACEKRDRQYDSRNYYSIGNKGEIIKVQIPNVTKIGNFFFKGINLIRIIPIFKKYAKKAIKKNKYDLVIYHSPPITIYKAVQLIKKRQGAKTYLLLKDIWPYDCIFGGVLSLHGWKKIAFDFLAFLARKLYYISDVIGCMSPANIKFLTYNEPKLDVNKIEVCPNSIKPLNVILTKIEKMEIREKYGIPNNKTVFVYGGNLGIPQGIDFAIDSIKESRKVENAFFVFVGGGTEMHKLENVNFNNFLLLPAMPKDEYEMLVFACDVGLVYLNHDCLSPNFPSRLLAYMQAGRSILCATDVYTDVGRIATENEYGLWCESNDLPMFIKLVKAMCDKDFREHMGCKAYNYLLEHYTVEESYKVIMSKFKNSNNI